MAAVGKKALQKGYKRFSTIAEKEDQTAIDEMVENGEIPPHLVFMANMNVLQLEKAMVGLIPVVKIDTGKYLVGSELKSLQIKGDTLLVRVGGGYVTLEEHILKVARYECLKINQFMKKMKLDFKNAVAAFLDKHKAHANVKKGFFASPSGTVEAFNSTMKILEKRQE